MNDELKETLRKAVQVQTLVIAGTVMTEMACKISGRFDTFGTWLLAGFGAGTALLLERHVEISVIPNATVKFIAILFLASVVVVIIEKYLAILVGAAAEVTALTVKEINDHFRKQREDKIEPSIDLTTFNEKLLLGLLPTHRWIVARSIKKGSDGDHSRIGRNLLKIAQFQGFLVLVEVGFFLWSIWHLIQTLPLDKG